MIARPTASRLFLSLFVAAASSLIWGCGGGETKTPAAGANESASADVTSDATSASASTAAQKSRPVPKAVDPVVVIHTTLGNIKLQLAAEKAPETVENFLQNYVNRGYYDNTIVHHVEPGSMVICGGYTADLQPKPSRREIRNESANGLSNRRGTVAMARNPELEHSATSQFFINVRDNTAFDYVAAAGEGDPQFGYCVFGTVIEGMDIVDRLAALPVAPQGEFEKVPTETALIQKVEQLR